MRQIGSIRNRFLAFALICMIPLAAVTFILLREVDSRARAELVTNESSISTIVTANAQSFLVSNFRTIENIAVMPPMIEQKDPEAVNRILSQVRTYRPEITGIFLAAPDGGIYGQAGFSAVDIHGNIQAPLETTLTTGQRTVSDRIDLQAEGETSVIVLIVPVVSIPDEGTVVDIATPASTPSDTAANPGDVVGAIGMIVPVDYVQQSVIPSLRSRTDIALISDDQVIAATGEIRAQEVTFLDNLRSELDANAQAGSDVFEITGLSGSRRVATYALVPSENADWAVVVSSPTTDRTLSSWAGALSLVTAIAGAVILLVAFAFGELSSRAFEDVTDHARSLAKGDYSRHLVPRGTGEAYAIGVALTTLRERLERQLAQLRERQSERQLQTEQMRDVLRRDLRVQEDERRHIASEIHDAVSPLITGALYQNRALQLSNGSTTPEDIKTSLEDVNQLLERATEELHGIIFDLRPPDLDDIGIVAAIEAFVSTIQRTGLETRLEVIGDIPAFTAEVRLGIYRIVQEALHNTLRHAGADEAVVRLEYTDDVLRVTIRDNGTGFDPERARRPTSLGLLSMRERAAAIDATFDIVSRPGGGTAIVIERKDTGSVMSDELLDDLLRQRVADNDHAELVPSGDSSDNMGDDPLADAEVDANSEI